MVNVRLLQILRCPESMQTVREATAEELQECNRRISQRTLVSRMGEIRVGPLQEGLIREDGTLIFPVENDIPVMLIEEALVLC